MGKGGRKDYQSYEAKEIRDWDKGEGRTVSLMNLLRLGIGGRKEREGCQCYETTENRDWGKVGGHGTSNLITNDHFVFVVDNNYVSKPLSFYSYF